MNSSSRFFDTGAGRLTIAALAVAITGGTAAAQDPQIEANHEPQAEHVEQQELFDLVAAGDHEEAFELAFETGDELFETHFNSLDGVGAQVGQGQRFSRVPRADLDGPGEWANHFPPRATGPNAQSCNSCHNELFDDGSGSAAANVHRDPGHTGSMGSFIIRNTPHVFAPGALQRLAEEMTERLHRQRDLAANAACLFHTTITQQLIAKGVGFGRIRVSPVSFFPCEVDIDVTQLEGVDSDLVVKPFQWKGNTVTLRDFNRGAGHNELGMQAVEIVGYGADGDFDGVADELTVGDMTALAIYLAAQPRPTTKLELDSLGLIPPLSVVEKFAIAHGAVVFAAVGCAGCHRPLMRIGDPVFSEPSQVAAFRDATFPAGLDPVAEKVDPSFSVTFDLTADQPDNVVVGPDGEEVHLGSFERDGSGRALVRLFGDLKRHEMGPALAETIDEAGTGPSTWMTKELWGVGGTGPWLHDGRATTLTEAILLHGGEAASSRSSFAALPASDQRDLIAFLDNLVLFKTAEE